MKRAECCNLPCPSLPPPAGSGHVLPLNMEGASSRFTAEQIRSMTADDVIEAWKEHLKELSQ